jgi:hypothetical protein
MIGYVNNLVALFALVCWIVYWVQMAGYGKRLRLANVGHDYYRDSDEADYADDYRPKAYRDNPDEDYDDDYGPRRRR